MLTMNRFRSISVCLGIMLLAGCSSEAPANRPGEVSSPRPIVLLINAEQFEEILKEERVILHLNADWSFQSGLSKNRVAELQNALAADSALAGIALRRIDCTNQDAMKAALDAWLKAEGASPSFSSVGSGELIWVKSGKFADSVQSTYQVPLPELLTRTRLVFPAKPAHPGS